MPRWQSEQQEICTLGVTCLHMVPSLLLMRKGKSCLTTPETKLPARAPAPDLAAMLLPPARGGIASRRAGTGLHLQTSPECLPEAGLGAGGCRPGSCSVAFAAGWRGERALVWLLAGKSLQVDFQKQAHVVYAELRHWEA